jgi:hypothetical protein
MTTGKSTQSITGQKIIKVGDVDVLLLSNSTNDTLQKSPVLIYTAGSLHATGIKGDKVYNY